MPLCDGSLVANECINAVVKRREERVLCKLDMEKASDKVDWIFLYYMVKRMGFEVRWRNWMSKCYRTASFLILLNRVSVDYFHSKRGLQQGDPLSPILFLVVAEAFNALLNRAFREGRYDRGF